MRALGARQAVPLRHDRQVSTLMRVARALSVLGFCSRRDGDRLVAEGRVSIDGRPVTSPSALVDLSAEALSVDGQAIGERPAFRYVALNKPPGVVSTARDPHASATVVDLVKSDVRLYPVGRLDKNSEGLMLLTNDGDFAQGVAHPKFRTEKEYLVLVRGPVAEAHLRRLRGGVELDGRQATPVAVGMYRGPLAPGRPTASKGGTWLRIVLHEGRNREVRRMLDAAGLAAVRLVRTRIGTVRLGRLAPGQSRALSTAEVRALASGGRTRSPHTGPTARTGGIPGGQAGRSRGRPFRNPPRADARREPSLIVAIDGPSAAGKSVVGTRVAERLGAVFLDTGVLYRALALLALERGISPADAETLASLARRLNVRVVRDDDDGEGWRVWLGRRDITAAIRAPEVEAQVSHVSAHAAVRKALIPAQRRAVGPGRVVAVGRDIGTVIFPEAGVKVYLDASPGERARRRAGDLGHDVRLDDVRNAMVRRDELDRGRSTAPLMAAPDAVVIDTEAMDVHAVVERVCALVDRRAGNG